MSFHPLSFPFLRNFWNGKRNLELTSLIPLSIPSLYPLVVRKVIRLLPANLGPLYLKYKFDKAPHCWKPQEKLQRVSLACSRCALVR